jgi:hypothetical protein
VSVRAGSTLTWRFLGDTLHNVTLANGPRGFSSPNLSDGRTYSKRLAVAGTYRLFCGLHPVDMTATVKVTRRKPALRRFFSQGAGSSGPTPLTPDATPGVMLIETRTDRKERSQEVVRLAARQSASADRRAPRA